MNRKLILAAAVAAGSFVGAAQAAPAVVDGAYDHGYPPTVRYHEPVQADAPPAPIHEAVPSPRPGFVWSPGHYQWRGDRYVWLSGHWLPARSGHAWQAPHWQRRADGSWFLVGGQWVPGDTYSYGRPYGDRDGDGVPNYYDRRDRNPYRY